jgi:DNA-directed RNA polymerase subunit RPC12/RpoP
MEKYKCPNCDKTIIENNQESFTNDIIIKSKLVFLNEDGKILCKCSNCKKTISLPLDFCLSKKEIILNQIIDL